MSGNGVKQRTKVVWVYGVTFYTRSDKRANRVAPREGFKVDATWTVNAWRTYNQQPLLRHPSSWLDTCIQWVRSRVTVPNIHGDIEKGVLSKGLSLLVWRLRLSTKVTECYAGWKIRLPPVLYRVHDKISADSRKFYFIVYRTISTWNVTLHHTFIVWLKLPT